MSNVVNMVPPNNYPAPLTPPDCDLRGYEFVQTYGHHLYSSRFYAKALRNPRGGLAAQKLWWVAWQQMIPAGSLPDDDDELAMLADFGTDTAGWMAARDVALHGFVKCSDGRLYHPYLCKLALEKYVLRAKDRERKRESRGRRVVVRGPSTSLPESVTVVSAGQDMDVRRTGHGRPCLSDVEGEGERESEKKIQKASPSAPADAVAAPADLSIRDILWRDGVPIIQRLTGRSDKACRAFLGKLLGAARDDCVGVNAALWEAANLKPADPGAWLMARVGGKTEQAAGKLGWTSKPLADLMGGPEQTPCIDVVPE